LSLYTLDVQRLYPGYLIWARSLVRLALAGVLYYLRPREAHWKPAGKFLSNQEAAVLCQEKPAACLRGYVRLGQAVLAMPKRYAKSPGRTGACAYRYRLGGGP